MKCLECQLEIESLGELTAVERDIIKIRRRLGKRDPEFSFHKWCDAPIKRICGGHVTPPGLEELEKGHKGRW